MTLYLYEITPESTDVSAIGQLTEGAGRPDRRVAVAN